MSFAVKYAPRSLKEFVNQEKAVKRVLSFLRNFGKERVKALLLYGPPGTGKTCLVRALARDLKYDLIELNASDKRDAREIRKVIGNAVAQRSLSGRPKLILLDEIDGIQGREDRGGVSEVIKIIQATNYPIILTANDPYNPKLRGLRNYVELVEFKKLGKRDLRKILERICKKEGIKFEPSALDLIVTFSKGDARSAINDLEMVSYGRKVVKEEDLLLSYRDREKNIFEALGMIFKGKSLLTALRAPENLDKDLSELILWIGENISREYEKPEEIAKAYDYLSKADVFLGRVRRTQYYRFQLYASILATGGVCIAKKEVYRKFTSFKSPSKIVRMWETKKFREILRSISDKISERCHVSSENAYKYYGFMLKFIFKNSKKMSRLLAEDLNLNKEEISFLTY